MGKNRRNFFLVFNVVVLIFSFIFLTQFVSAVIAKTGTDTSNESTSATVTILQFSHTLVAGSNRLVVVSTGIENAADDDIYYVTYGGTNMTRAVYNKTATSGTIYLAGIYYLLESDLASMGDGSKTIIINMSSASTMEAEAVASEYTGIYQGAPEATSINNTLTTGVNTIINTISPSKNAWVISAVGCGNGVSYTHGGSQVEIYDHLGLASSSGFSVAELRGANAETSLNSTTGASSNRQVRLAASFTGDDTESPKWYTNSTNSTLAGSTINYSVNWTDNVSLSSYIFSWCNGTYNTTTTKVYNKTLLVEATGTAQTFTGVVNQTNHAYAVNDTLSVGVTYNDSDYIYARTRILNDTFVIENFSLPSNSVINNLTISMRAIRYNLSGVGTRRNLNAKILSRGTQANGTNILTTTGVVQYDTAFTTDPSTSATWNESGINYTEVGVIAATNATGGGGNVTALWTNVWYTTSSYPISSCSDASPTFTNDSSVSMIGTGNWSNITKVVNETVGSIIKWMVYANDSSNNLNVTDTFQYTTTTAGADSTLPQWSSNMTNSTLAGSTINHSVNWSDNIGLSGYIFSFDNGNGTLYNDTWRAMTSDNWSNVTKVANSTFGSIIKWMVYANDTTNNLNVTNTFQYTTTTIPQIQFVPPTPNNATSTTNTSQIINVSMNISSATSLANFTWNWDGTNYTLYNDSLVLMMNFDNVSALGENDTKIVDLSKNGNNLTCTNCPTLNKDGGRYGSAYMFNNQNFSSDTTSGLANFTSVTISFWINPSSYAGMPDWLGYTGGTNGWSFYGYPGGPSAGFVYGTYTLLSADTDAVPTSVWTHVAAVHDGANDMDLIYINGVLSNSSTGKTSDVESSTGSFAIGGTDTYPNQLSGMVDELRIWNISLSAAEISQEYHSNLNKYDTNNWSYYTNQTGLTPQTYTYYAFVSDAASNSNSTATNYLIVTSGGADSCTCTNGSVWTIINGDQCSLSDACNLGANPVRVLNGGLRITSTGMLNAQGCYVQDTEALFTTEGGKLICR